MLKNTQQSVSATLALPVQQDGAVFTPKIDRSTSIDIPAVGKAGPYTVFSTVHTQDLNVVQVFGGSLDIMADGLGRKVEFFKLNTLLRR